MELTYDPKAGDKIDVLGSMNQTKVGFFTKGLTNG